ncbi:MAG: hypothetical protein AAFR61_30565 [Bacteroidota bacterium]
MKHPIYHPATTQTIDLAVPYQTAFEYLANPLHQAEWAINFVKSVREMPEGFLAETPGGWASLVIDADPEKGTLDIILGGGKPIPTRLLPNGAGCTYVFTLAKPENMPVEAWEKEGIPGLCAELAHLKTLLENRHAASTFAA